VQSEVKNSVEIEKATKKSNFSYSNYFLPKEKIEAMKVIYSFCRKSDDIVDDISVPVEDRLSCIKSWRESLSETLNGKPGPDILNNLNEIINRFKIPHKPFYDLIDGMEMDLVKTRYETFEELRDYCYKAASSVGLMSIEVFGYTNEKTKQFAENLGIALQLTNILRDVRKDLALGRIYLPASDMMKFNYSEPELIANEFNNSFIELMRYETSVAKGFYETANSFLTKEDKGLLFSARIMQHIYYSILLQIERMNYNVFAYTARISKFKKFLIAYGVFLKYKLLYNLKDNRVISTAETI